MGKDKWRVNYETTIITILPLITIIIMIIMITTRWAARSCSRSRGCAAHEVEGRERKIALQVIDDVDDTDGSDVVGDDDDLSCFVFGDVDDEVFQVFLG